MKRHTYEAVIQNGRVLRVVQYESYHRKGSRANKVDMINAFGKIYGKGWSTETVIHEWKMIG